MQHYSISSHGSLIAPLAIPEGAQDFSNRMTGLLDGQPKDDATVEQALEGMDAMLDAIAAGLYSMASMLVGEGEEGIRLVETTVATTEVSICQDAVSASRNSRKTLACAALGVLARRDADSLVAPEGVEFSGGCIEEDDLEAAGVSRAQLEQMIAGPDRDRVRSWLAKLPVDVRTVFVLRAVGPFTAADTAELLAMCGGPRAKGWNAEGVRIVFRQGLCSLASQLLQATTRK
jgi:hypothetical protein